MVFPAMILMARYSMDLIGILAHDLDRDQRGLRDLLIGIPAVGEDRLDEGE